MTVGLPSFGFFVKWSGDPGRGMESVMTIAYQMTVLYPAALPWES